MFGYCYIKDYARCHAQKASEQLPVTGHLVSSYWQRRNEVTLLLAHPERLHASLGTLKI